MNEPFEHPYLIFDEFGLREVLCMCCSDTIKSRTEQRSKLDPSLVLRDMAKHADYREIPVKLSDGNIAFLMVCDACKFVEIGDHEADLVTKQINEAIRQQLEWEGKTTDVINEVLKTLTKRIVRKAEAMEVAQALRGV